ncbi:GNAT family N-acetyltransferase [Butyrivibrio sp. AE3004]|uniref:GNAT family N-acetyltransferase n=1 Tax=Butyrivibrio sp. AE3004 TaxID=1506994 RepID=UPI0004948AAD|nr:GNAT family N-acetyltransferase [Butyrivibrio sp. AE3004]
MKKLFSEIPYIKGDRLTLKKITREDAPALGRMVASEAVYRYEPTFLFEKKYPDINYVIDHLYTECFEESIILGIFQEDEFCGLAEFYGYKDNIHKVSIGVRLMEEYWGQGIGAETVKMMVEYLNNETDIEIIAASVLPANKGSDNIVRKLGFSLVVQDSDEDWGYGGMTPTDKWII